MEIPISTVRLKFDSSVGPNRILRNFDGIIEAPPFYGSVRLKRSTSGTRVKVTGLQTRTEIFDWSVEHTWTNRLSIRSRGIADSATGAGDGSGRDIGDINTTFGNTTDFLLGLDRNGIGVGRSNPKKSFPEIYCDPYIEEDVKILDYTVVQAGFPDDTGEIFRDVTIGLGSFYAKGPDSPVGPSPRWDYSLGWAFNDWFFTYWAGAYPFVVNTSALSDAAWRDMRGEVFAATIPEDTTGYISNTVVHHIEWEIG